MIAYDPAMDEKKKKCREITAMIWKLLSSDYSDDSTTISEMDFRSFSASMRGDRGDHMEPQAIVTCAKVPGPVVQRADNFIQRINSYPTI